MTNGNLKQLEKTVYCAANKHKGTFAQFSTAVKNNLFRAYCMQT